MYAFYEKLFNIQKIKLNLFLKDMSSRHLHLIVPFFRDAS